MTNITDIRGMKARIVVFGVAAPAVTQSTT